MKDIIQIFERVSKYSKGKETQIVCLGSSRSTIELHPLAFLGRRLDAKNRQAECGFSDLSSVILANGVEKPVIEVTD